MSPYICSDIRNCWVDNGQRSGTSDVPMSLCHLAQVNVLMSSHREEFSVPSYQYTWQKDVARPRSPVSVYLEPVFIFFSPAKVCINQQGS